MILPVLHARLLTYVAYPNESDAKEVLKVALCAGAVFGRAGGLAV